MNVVKRITKTLKQDGVKKQPIKNYINGIYAFSDLELYKDMSRDEIIRDFRLWWSKSPSYINV
jgi:hypothetical protein